MEQEAAGLHQRIEHLETDMSNENGGRYAITADRHINRSRIAELRQELDKLRRGDPNPEAVALLEQRIRDLEVEAEEKTVPVDGELSYDEASEQLRLFESELAGLPAGEQSEAYRTKVAPNLKSLRERLDSIRGKAPDAWGEMRDAFVAAYHELKSGYESAKTSVNGGGNR